MQGAAALDVALTLMEHPPAVRHASHSALPEGMTLLLQVAASEPGAMRLAQATTGRSQAALQRAAGFFIEQVLFGHGADCYRILGTKQGAARGELRHHMALLVRWLHPDGQEPEAREPGLAGREPDRGILIHRVTRAWDNLKTEERRTAYDRALRERKKSPLPHGSTRPRAAAKTRRRPLPAAGSTLAQKRRPGTARLAIHAFERETLWVRLFSYLWTRP